jgi:hypothetical protein
MISKALSLSLFHVVSEFQLFKCMSIEKRKRRKFVGIVLFIQKKKKKIKWHCYLTIDKEIVTRNNDLKKINKQIVTRNCNSTLTKKIVTRNCYSKRKFWKIFDEKNFGYF